MNCPECGDPTFVRSASCKHCGFKDPRPHPCSVGEQHHAEILKSWEELRTHAVDCGHAEYLVWKLDSGFLENSAQATLKTDDKWHHEYCWFCGNSTESGTLVRWFPLDHVAFHEECVRKLGWERRYLTKAQWIDRKRKFRISWKQQLKERPSEITSSVARDYSLPL